MSVIASYARLDANSVDLIRSNPDWLDVLYTKAIPDAEVIDIDKACDGIVWLLSRLPAPPGANVEGAGFVLRSSLAPLLRGEGGVPEPRLNAPYGPASSLSARQVAELNSWLQSIDEVQMRSRYEPRAMHSDQVYPQIWAEEGLAGFDEYLLPRFRALQNFFSRAGQAGQQVLVFFT
jgi:hypothetical protein